MFRRYLKVQRFALRHGRALPHYLPTLTVLALMALTILSVTGIRGFMWSHAGTAGSHLLSVALNSWGAPLFMHATMLYADGHVLAYNHPAPLFLWVQALVAGIPHTFLGRLTAAYYLSATISAFTLGLLYVTLVKFNIRRGAAAVTVLVLCGTDLYVTFRGFITYDILSPLLSILFLLAITRLELSPSRRNIKLFLATGIFALMSSYYAVTIIAVYLSSHMLAIWRQHGLRAALTSWPATCAAILGGFTILQFALLNLQEYLATGALTSWHDAMGRQSSLNTTANTSVLQSLPNDIYLLLHHLLAALPIAGVLFLARQSNAKNKGANHTQWHALCTAALYVTAGATLFICLTYGWSTVHPFAYFWYAAPLAVAVAFGINALPQGPVFILFAIPLFLNALFQMYVGYSRDYYYGLGTSPLFRVLDEVFPPGTTYQYMSEGECGPFTSGPIIFIGSHPNHWLQTANTPVNGIKPPFVGVVCNANSLSFIPSNSPEKAVGITF